MFVHFTKKIYQHASRTVNLFTFYMHYYIGICIIGCNTAQIGFNMCLATHVYVGELWSNQLTGILVHRPRPMYKCSFGFIGDAEQRQDKYI